MATRKSRRARKQVSQAKGSKAVVTVEQALTSPSLVKDKTLAGSGKTIASVTQSREAEFQGFAHVVFTDRTFSTVKLDEVLTVA